MGSTKREGFKIKRTLVRSKGYEYSTFRLSGWLNGQRVRKNLKSEEEAEGEEARLEIKATDGKLVFITQNPGESFLRTERCFFNRGIRVE